MRTTVLITIFAALSAASAGAEGAGAGKGVYEKSCKTCHGADGTPNPAIANMMKAQIPDLKSPEVQALSDAQIGNIIEEGKGKMRPIKTVSASDANDVAAYVHTLKK